MWLRSSLLLRSITVVLQTSPVPQGFVVPLLAQIALLLVALCSNGNLEINQDIKKGDIITRDKIAIKGPGVGLHPRYFDVVIGRSARQALEADYPITWDVV